MNVFEAVKQSVTTRQAAEYYGIHVGRNGMACCPFHNDKTPSMKLDRRYHCFGCGADGDVIDFAAALYGLGKKEAAVQLAQDFGLSYEDWKPPGKVKKPKPRQKSPEEQFQEAKNRCFRILADYLHLLRAWRTDYAPHSPEEAFHPRFIEALQKQDQVEYLLEGKGNDLDNLRGVANKILLVREAANMAYLLQDGAKRNQAGATASLIAAVLGLPELADPLELLILFAWAYAESVQDLRILFDGKKVPIMKTAESWNTPYSQLLTFRNHLGDYHGGQEGMTYQEYLEAFLYLQPIERTSERLMDVMESDIRMTPGNGSFRMDGCVDAMTAEAYVESGYGYSYQIKRAYQYE